VNRPVQDHDPPAQSLLLALHTSSETLGVGLQRLDVEAPPRLAAFPLGRALSNRLIGCVETCLPAELWPRLGRLAVATGPGGFTGTRLGVVFTRTLAQQLNLPLDGISSFHLIASRLHRRGEAPAGSPFWLVQELPRRGPVAGLYLPDPGIPGGISERIAPRLFHSVDEINALQPCPRLPAHCAQPEDVAELLALSCAAAAVGAAAPWPAVVPIYPTSPVGPMA
jgi:tRNA threonylcarbamoyl adenosine modification protein YeaZ